MIIVIGNGLNKQFKVVGVLLGTNVFGERYESSSSLSQM